MALPAQMELAFSGLALDVVLAAHSNGAGWP